MVLFEADVAMRLKPIILHGVASRLTLFILKKQHKNALVL
ncbi:hypothetical protein T479_14070 [Lysinibacillus varians]|nr:hypothetical protein T479_14070 [Lysinibacillus varians]